MGGLEKCERRARYRNVQRRNLFTVNPGKHPLGPLCRIACNIPPYSQEEEEEEEEGGLNRGSGEGRRVCLVIRWDGGVGVGR